MSTKLLNAWWSTHRIFLQATKTSLKRKIAETLEKARIRVQISAKHSKQEIAKATEAFFDIGKELGVIS